MSQLLPSLVEFEQFLDREVMEFDRSAQKADMIAKQATDDRERQIHRRISFYSETCRDCTNMIRAVFRAKVTGNPKRGDVLTAWIVDRVNKQMAPALAEDIAGKNGD